MARRDNAYVRVTREDNIKLNLMWDHFWDISLNGTNREHRIAVQHMEFIGEIRERYHTACGHKKQRPQAEIQHRVKESSNG